VGYSASIATGEGVNSFLRQKKNKLRCFSPNLATPLKRVTSVYRQVKKNLHLTLFSSLSCANLKTSLNSP
jgi:hypothetical protein